MGEKGRVIQMEGADWDMSQVLQGLLGHVRDVGH